LLAKLNIARGGKRKTFLREWVHFLRETWKNSKNFLFAMVHASNVEPDVFWAERARRQKTGRNKTAAAGRLEKELQKRKNPAAES
jgi:hypothetical protein